MKFNNEIKFLTSSIKGTINVEVLDELGKTVFVGSKNTDGVHAVVLTQTATLSKGIYFLRVTKGDETFVRRVVKM